MSSEWTPQAPAHPLLGGVLQQDHVTVGLAARNGQKLAVARPGKVEDQIGLEVGELSRLAAGKRLRPEIRYTVVINDVSQRLSVRGEPEALRLRVRRNRIERIAAVAGNYGPQDAEIRHAPLHRVESDPLPVGRQSRSVPRPGTYARRGASVNGDFPDRLSRLVQGLVYNPLPVRRADGTLIFWDSG